MLRWSKRCGAVLLIGAGHPWSAPPKSANMLATATTALDNTLPFAHVWITLDGVVPEVSRIAGVPLGIRAERTLLLDMIADIGTNRFDCVYDFGDLGPTRSR